VVWWTYISEHNYDSQVKAVVKSLFVADYARKKLEELQKTLNIDIWLSYTPLILSIRFRKPKDEIVHKYTLAVETLNYNGKPRTYIHAYMMRHVTTKLIDDLVADLHAPDAFNVVEDDEAKNQRKLLRALNKSEANDATANFREGLIIGKRNKGVEKGTKKLLHWPVQGRGSL